MNSGIETNQRVARVKEYFRKGDAGDATIIEMFTDDIELYFPKFGLRSGKQAVAQFVQGLQAQLAGLQHYPDEYTYIVAGDVVVAEGWESGEMKDGTRWPVHGSTDGRFCNVFRFRGDLISQLHIYVDPDFAGRDEQRFYWGKQV
ncbi:ketosteroid isomerase-like protein [Paraburkholderia sp. GAS199]|uniref:nuclear transport factor 2 family protein n=1 Tax=Paraburkholderia sp. GAS199 TaxID=3035126 RepID=UPI003D1BDFFA